MKPSLVTMLLLTLLPGAAWAARAPDVPYFPTWPESVTRMLALAEVGPQDTVYDLGSGDGRIVIAAALRHGARGVGIEIDPHLVRESRLAAEAAGVAARVRFLEADLFEAAIADASVVTLYLQPELNLRLRPRLLAELAPGTRVISNTHDMGDWRPDAVVRESGLLLYRWVVPAPVAGEWCWRDAAGSYRLVLNQRYQDLQGHAWLDGEPVEVEKLALDGARLSLVLRRGGMRRAFRGVFAEGALRVERADGPRR